MTARLGGGFLRTAACLLLLVATGACATSAGAPSGGGQPSATQPPVAATAAAATAPPSTPTPVPYRPQVVTTFNMTEFPWAGITLNEGTHRLYLSVLSGLQVIDTVTGNVVAINFPATYLGPSRINPTSSLAVNTKTNRVYVLDGFAGVLSILDGATNSVLDSVTFGLSPTRVAVNSVTGRVYVTNTPNNILWVLDSASNRIVATVALQTPIAVVVSEALNRVYVSVSDGLVVIDGATNTILQTLPYSLSPSALSDAPARIYGADGDVVRVYDVAAGTWTTAATIRYVSGLSVDARGDRLYVAEDLNNGGGMLHIFSADGTRELGSVPIDGVPRSISADSSSGRVYVGWSTEGCSPATPGVCQGGVLVVQGAGPP